MEPFKLKKNSIEYFTLSKWIELVPNLSVGFSTRNNGYSQSEYKSFNLALHVNDNEQHVINNRKKLANEINFPFESWTSAEQVHGNKIEVVTLDNKGKGKLKQNDSIKQTDGIVTDNEDILLTSFYADCVPLFFLDPEKKVIGLAHAGWKGTVLKIGEKMIDTMVTRFNSNPTKILAAIGPSIGQCCYEVNKDVIDSLNSAISNIPNNAIIDKGNGHYDLDLKKINQQILIKAGILPENIEISSLCTSCNVELFYSHRRDRGKTGRMASWIGLRKDD